MSEMVNSGYNLFQTHAFSGIFNGHIHFLSLLKYDPTSFLFFFLLSFWIVCISFLFAKFLIHFNCWKMFKSFSFSAYMEEMFRFRICCLFIFILIDYSWCRFLKTTATPFRKLCLLLIVKTEEIKYLFVYNFRFM